MSPVGLSAVSKLVPQRFTGQSIGIFFVSLPIAAMLTTATRTWTTASIGLGLLFLLSHVPLLWPGWPGSPEIATVLPRGLVERGLLLTDMALLASLTKQVTR